MIVTVNYIEGRDFVDSRKKYHFPCKVITIINLEKEIYIQSKMTILFLSLEWRNEDVLYAFNFCLLVVNDVMKNVENGVLYFLYEK